MLIEPAAEWGVPPWILAPGSGSPLTWIIRRAAYYEQKHKAEKWRSENVKKPRRKRF
jgi:hypothetical protein